MIKLLTTAQIRELDAYTIQHEPVASIDLMERACDAFAGWFSQQFKPTQRVGVVCGTGNNGGDGLGIARLLFEWGFPVRVWIVDRNQKTSPDFDANLERLPKSIEIVDISAEPSGKLFADCDVIVDAIFGSGLTRPAAGLHAATIAVMNNTKAVRVSVDIPSGLRADSPSAGEIVCADYTISFQLPKLAFLLPQNEGYTGVWKAVPIGLSKEAIKAATANHYLITKKDIVKLKRPRKKFDHKGTYGHALLIAGSYGKIGAVVLAARATMRSGVGLLTAHVPACGYVIMQTAIPEAMISVDRHEHFFSHLAELAPYKAIGVGPGLGQEAATLTALRKLLETTTAPLVIDADALNLLSAHSELLHMVPAGSVLTPHPGEFARLAGRAANDFERLTQQQELARRLRSVVILKGAYTSVASPEGVIYFNSTGNPGMATAGSGDVLTGLITGLLAQGYSAIDAALIGVFVHGQAGDLVAHEKGMDGLIASDLVEAIPTAIYRLYH